MSIVALIVRVTPRADRNVIVGVRENDGVLLLRVSSPLVDGAANKAVVELVADALGIRKSAVTLIGGATAREKRLAIEGLTEAEKTERLAKLPRVTNSA